MLRWRLAARPATHFDLVGVGEVDSIEVALAAGHQRHTGVAHDARIHEPGRVKGACRGGSPDPAGSTLRQRQLWMLGVGHR